MKPLGRARKPVDTVDQETRLLLGIVNRGLTRGPAGDAIKQGILLILLAISRSVLAGLRNRENVREHASD
jgi:hypothetical protein